MWQKKKLLFLLQKYIVWHIKRTGNYHLRSNLQSKLSKKFITKSCGIDPFSTGKMEVGYIWAAHSIPLSILNRLIPIMPLKSEFLAPASRSKVPRASISVKWQKFIVGVDLVVVYQAVYRIKTFILTYFFHVKYPYRISRIERINRRPRNLSMTSLSKPEVAYSAPTSNLICIPPLTWGKEKKAGYSRSNQSPR